MKIFRSKAHRMMFEEKLNQALDSSLQTNQALCKKAQESKIIIEEMVDVLREVLHHAMGAGSNWELTHQYPDKASDMDWIGRKVRDTLSALPKEYLK